MLKLKSILNITLAISSLALITSCSDDSENLLDTTQNNTNELQFSARASASSPFSFSSAFRGDDFQVDNDGNGAHNWNEEEYEEDPVDNGFDVTDFIYVSNDRLILECPNGERDDRRRAEYRDQVNIDLNDRHRMDFTFNILNYDNDSELIMAQLHNDNRDARRPYITVLAEDGRIRIQRTNAPNGSSTLRGNQTMPFRANDRYRVRIDTRSGTRNVFTRIINVDTVERVQETFSFANDWDDLDGDFYWKFGAYMPDGGSTNTQMSVRRINIMGQ